MHPLLILVLVFDLLIAVSSVLNLVNMMRVNLMVEERRAPQVLRCAGAVRHRRPPAPPPCPAVDHGGRILGSAGGFRPPLSRLFPLLVFSAHGFSPAAL